MPDNVEEEGVFEAARVSPTNFGLLLNARQAANTFGYLTIPELVALTERSLQTYDKMEKFRGHIFNWYDTRTLAPIRPITISSVDSGNLAASFYTLRTGCRSLLREPLLNPALFTGIRDHWQLLMSLPDAPAELKDLAPPAARGRHGEMDRLGAGRRRGACLYLARFGFSDRARQTGGLEKPTAASAPWSRWFAITCRGSCPSSPRCSLCPSYKVSRMPRPQSRRRRRPIGCRSRCPDCPGLYQPAFRFAPGAAGRGAAQFAGDRQGEPEGAGPRAAWIFLPKRCASPPKWTLAF